mmetsp:Transcript_44391/g.128323  ORF Transcript_44391/g.128323 Transcript_44391/m.128323 type:complete len:364 (-) Transcript_44391:84-1175(-)
MESSSPCDAGEGRVPVFHDKAPPPLLASAAAAAAPVQHRPMPQSPAGIVRRTCATPLGSHAVHASAGGCIVGPPATPTNRDRPDLQHSVNTMAASFRGSAAPLAVSPLATPHSAGFARTGDVPSSPPPLPGQPLPPQTPGGDARPSSSGSATTQFRRVAISPLGASPLVAPCALGGDAAVAAPFAVLATPTNADRKIMLARSTRSIRGNVLAARATPDQAAEDLPPDGRCPPSMPPRPSTSSSCVATPSSASVFRRKGSAPTLAAANVGSGGHSWDAGPLATPMNGDRRDLNASMVMGTPAFRGSAQTPSGLTASPAAIVAAPCLVSVAAPHAGAVDGLHPLAPALTGQCSTPGGLSRCFQRT